MPRASPLQDWQHAAAAAAHQAAAARTKQQQHASSTSSPPSSPLFHYVAMASRTKSPPHLHHNIVQPAQPITNTASFTQPLSHCWPIISRPITGTLQPHHAPRITFTSRLSRITFASHLKHNAAQTHYHRDSTRTIHISCTTSAHDFPNCTPTMNLSI